MIVRAVAQAQNCRPRGTTMPSILALALLLLALGLPLSGAAAEDPAEPPPAPEPPLEAAPSDETEEDEDLFARLLEGQGDGEWRGVLNRILETKDGAWIGQELGALFRDRDAFADRADLAAFAAAYLADRPNGGSVLLGDEIIRRSYGDEAFLDGLKRRITVGEGGWGRLLDHARKLLAAEDLRDRAVGAWFLSREDGAQRERVRQDLLERARADLPRIEIGGAEALRLSDAYLDAFAALLAYRFASVPEAVEALGARESLDLAALIADLSRRKDAPASPLARKALEWGKRLVDAGVAGGNAAALEEFLDPRRTTMTPVRRYAMLKASALTPSADGTWAGILTTVLQAEEDGEVLRGALDLLEKIPFADRPDHALELSVALARRLEARGPLETASRDRKEDRIRMAQGIGALRLRTAELQALLDRSERLEPEIAAELVRTLGRLDGTSAEEIVAYFRAAAGEGARERQIRLAAVEALGLPGVRATDAEEAAAVLRTMIAGDEEGEGRLDDSVLRRHALRSLGNHPGEATADVLRNVAEMGPEQEATVALVVLRKAAVSDVHAVGALTEIAKAETAATPRRLEALQALAGLGGAGQEDAVESARGTAQEILESSANAAVRLEAARTAAVLADPTALQAVAALWLEAPDAREWWEVLGDLINAVAARGDQHDGAIAAVLLELDGRVPVADLEALSGALLERHPRTPFRWVRSKLLLGRATAPETPAEAAIAALEEADLLLQAILGPEPEDERYGALGLRVRVQRALGERKDDLDAKKAHWLEATRLAARSARVEVATDGREIAQRLAAPPLADSLTPAESSRLEEDLAAIEKVLLGDD